MKTIPELKEEFNSYFNNQIFQSRCDAIRKKKFSEKILIQIYGIKNLSVNLLFPDCGKGRSVSPKPGCQASEVFASRHPAVVDKESFRKYNQFYFVNTEAKEVDQDDVFLSVPYIKSQRVSINLQPMAISSAQAMVLVPLHLHPQLVFCEVSKMGRDVNRYILQLRDPKC